MDKNVARILRYAQEQLITVEGLKAASPEVTKGTGRAIAAIHNALWLLESDQVKGPVLRKRLLPHPVQWSELDDDAVAQDSVVARKYEEVFGSPSTPPQVDPPGGWTPEAVDQAAFKPQVTMDHANQLCALPNPKLSRKMQRLMKLGQIVSSWDQENERTTIVDSAVMFSLGYLREKIAEVDKQLEATDATGNVLDVIEMEVVPPFQNIAIKPLNFVPEMCGGDEIQQASVFNYVFQIKGHSPAKWRYRTVRNMSKYEVPWEDVATFSDAIHVCNAVWRELLSDYVTVEQPKREVELPEKVIR